MKQFYFENHRAVVRFDPGDELLSSLAELAKTQGWNVGTFDGLGSAKDVILSFYNLTTQSYQDREFNEAVEVVNITGNLVSTDGEVVVHAHGVFSRGDFTTLGGHIKKLVVSATCEVTLQILSGKLERREDVITGLNVLG